VTQEPLKDSTATRRGVLAGVGLVGLAGVITACGAGGGPSAEKLNGGGTTGGATTGAGSVASAPASSGAAGVLASTSQISVGSGMIFTAKRVVVTQPTAGDYKAFSAVCTHMGCLVNQISGGTIDCPCHGSEYSIATGAVVRGPAPLPLPAKKISITGDSIFLE
jgi:nitrite reductase/ring-hydroxylating ferredoxin subunit